MPWVCLALGGNRMSGIVDGTSHTAVLGEDTGRNFDAMFPFTLSRLPDPVLSGTPPTFGASGPARGCTFYPATQAGFAFQSNPLPFGNNIYSNAGAVGGASGITLSNGVTFTDNTNASASCRAYTRSTAGPIPIPGAVSPVRRTSSTREVPLLSLASIRPAAKAVISNNAFPTGGPNVGAAALCGRHPSNGRHRRCVGDHAVRLPVVLQQLRS